MLNTIADFKNALQSLSKAAGRALFTHDERLLTEAILELDMRRTEMCSAKPVPSTLTNAVIQAANDKELNLRFVSPVKLSHTPTTGKRVVKMAVDDFEAALAAVRSAKGGES